MSGDMERSENIRCAWSQQHELHFETPPIRPSIEDLIWGVSPCHGDEFQYVGHLTPDKFSNDGEGHHKFGTISLPKPSRFKCQFGQEKNQWDYINKALQDNVLNCVVCHASQIINIDKTFRPEYIRLCASANWVYIDSGDGLPPTRHQSIAWTNAVLLTITTLVTSVIF